MSLNEQFRSLPEAFRSIPIPSSGSWLRRFLAFAGPAYLVSVGYMDPGNWGTDLAGGSKFGFALLWVILASNLMAQFLQVLCARLGLVTGKDLAMACRDYYSKPVAIVLWFLCEIAIIACDLAEVVGAAIALQLLFGIPLVAGVLITAADVLVLLALMSFGFRKIEAIILVLVGTVFACFAAQMVMTKPDVVGIAKGMFIPSMPNNEALLISLGILGATVMPHNLYLHSSIVQTRQTEDLKESIKFNTVDTVVALSLAFFVNAAILILAAAVFWGHGQVIEEIGDAHQLLNGLLGGASATVFAVALLAAGQSSTITGTLAGQIVMEGFLRIKIKPWVRRLLTRSLAIIPALILINAHNGKETVQLLVLSQVVLSMQLPFAIFPLVAFTSNRDKMGEFVNKPWARWLGYAIAAMISGLNVWLLDQTIGRPWVAGGLAVIASFAIWVKWGYKPTQAARKVN